MNIGQRITLARVKAKLNKAELARRIGTTKSNITRWERTTSPGINNLILLSKELNVSIEWLLEGTVKYKKGYQGFTEFKDTEGNIDALICLYKKKVTYFSSRIDEQGKKKTIIEFEDI